MARLKRCSKQGNEHPHANRETSTPNRSRSKHRDAGLASRTWGLAGRTQALASRIRGIGWSQLRASWSAWNWSSTRTLVRELHKLVLEDLGGSWGVLGACKIKIHRLCRCLGGSQITIRRACGCLEASWNVPKSRSVVPVSVWRPPSVLRSHNLSCLSVFGGPLGGYDTFRTPFDPAAAQLRPT